MKKDFKDEAELLHWALLENAEAIAYCLAIGQLSQALDDVVDGDKPVSAEELCRAFWVMLVDLPNNAFVQQYGSQLSAVLGSAFNSWLDANELEKGSDHDKNLAFVLRDALVDVVCFCALKVGGFVWMRKVSVIARRFLLDETVDVYKKGLEAEL